MLTDEIENKNKFKTKYIVIKRIRTKLNSINQWLDFFKFMQA